MSTPLMAVRHGRVTPILEGSSTSRTHGSRSSSSRARARRCLRSLATRRATTRIGRRARRSSCGEIARRCSVPSWMSRGTISCSACPAVGRRSARGCRRSSTRFWRSTSPATSCCTSRRKRSRCGRSSCPTSSSPSRSATRRTRTRERRRPMRCTWPRPSPRSTRPRQRPSGCWRRSSAGQSPRSATSRASSRWTTRSLPCAPWRRRSPACAPRRSSRGSWPSPDCRCGTTRMRRRSCTRSW
mmetsp:Transcript_70091/g.203211  ORF Transcript_70091/g.203211 Transcript_70091/m.203211 type:complete len:242 (-) Transcript_70091:63-788(-)